MRLSKSTPMTPELTALIERARTHRMTPNEVFEQKVSFVIGQLWGDQISNDQRDDMRRRVIESQGAPSIETLRRLGYQ
jgi:hypothetical protein